MGSRLSSLVVCHSASPQTKPVFDVKATADNDFLGCGQLEITGDYLLLQLADGNKDRYTWPIRAIRRYGYEKNLFIFESGRRCATGPGTYQLKTKEAAKIIHLVQQSVTAIQEADDATRRAMLEAAPQLHTVERRGGSDQDDGDAGKQRYINCDSLGRPLVTNYASLDLPRKVDSDDKDGNSGDDVSDGESRGKKRGSGTHSPVLDTVEYVRIDSAATRALLS